MCRPQPWAGICTGRRAVQNAAAEQFRGNGDASPFPNTIILSLLGNLTGDLDTLVLDIEIADRRLFNGWFAPPRIHSYCVVSSSLRGASDAVP